MMNMKNCNSCNQEVAKNAKVCPNCGQKLKMGFFAKLGILIVVFIGIGIVLSPSAEDIQKKLTEIELTAPSSTSSSGELASMFSLISDSTDIQRENKENELQGQIVEWSLPVFDVNVQNAESNVYRIQTSRSSNTVGVFVEIYARNDLEARDIEALNPDDIIHFKGEISGTFLRNIEVKYARLVK
jgi:hypothetical protein